MKKLFITLVAMVALIGATFAATTSQSIAPNRVTSLISSNTATINSITVQNTGAIANATIVFYDAPWTNLVWTNGSYTTTGRTNGTYSQIYTNFFGNLWTNYFSNSWISYTITNAANTNFYTTVWSTLVASNTTATFEPPSGTRVNRGLVLTNSSGVVVTVDYSQ